MKKSENLTSLFDLCPLQSIREAIEEAIEETISVSEFELNGAKIRLVGVAGLPDDKVYLIGAEPMPKGRPQDYLKGKKKPTKKSPKKKGGGRKK